jgi:hypothetical protein
MPRAAMPSTGLRLHAPMQEPVLVAHVKQGYESRRRSIERQLRDLRMPFEFMLDGDVPDLTPAVMTRWFAPQLEPAAMQSCSCKHLLMYERIVAEGWPGALILEDDIVLADSFVQVFGATIHELRSSDDSAVETAWVSYENSTLRMPRGSQLRKGVHLYPASRTRCTGAYYVGRRAAQALLRLAETVKVSAGIDIWVDSMAARAPDEIRILWCHPTVAEQGSMNGLFDSMDPRRRASLWRRLKWNADKLYKTVRSRAA